MRKHLLLVTCIFLSIGVIDLVTCMWYIGFTERRLPELHYGKTACAIILSGDFDEKGRIGEETCRRCSHVLHLYNEKRVVKIICSGGYRPWRKETTAEQAVRWLKAHHIPENALFAENRSCSTIHNLQNSLTIAKGLGCRNISIISSSIHLFRVQKLLSDMHMPTQTELFFEAYPTAESHPRVGFFTLLKQVHHEWIAFALYKLLPRSWYNRLVFFLRRCS